MAGTRLFRERWLRLLLAVCCVGLVSSLWAQSPLEKLLPPKDSIPRPKLLVLKSGQVLQGEIEGRIGGYEVHTPTSSMVIQYDDVRTSAMSLEDAYQRMAANVRNPTANDRIELAQWCVQVGLKDQARDELLSALILEPERIEARRLLIQVEGGRGASLGPAGTGVDVTMAQPRSRPNAMPSTGQISRERVAEFTRQIQPLMLNTCGNAACHGGDKAGDFHLRPTARLSRLDTDANLEEILKWVDTVQPESSRLLTIPRQTIGAHAAAFRGPKAEDQYARLKSWIAAVARETRPAEASLAESSSGTGGVVPAAAFIEAGERPWPTADGAGALSPRAPTLEQSSRQPAVNDAFLRKVLEESRPDAFDPEEFNRRVHGAAAGRLSAGER